MNVLDEKEIERRKNLCIFGGSKDAKEFAYYKYLLSKEDLIKNNIPVEMLWVEAVKNRSIKDTWEYMCYLFDLCRTDFSNEEIGKRVGLSRQSVWMVKRGKMYGRHKKIYDKYCQNRNIFNIYLDKDVSEC